MRTNLIGMLFLTPVVAFASDIPDTFAVTAGMGASGNQLSSLATVQFQRGNRNDSSSRMEIVQLIFDTNNRAEIQDNRVTQATGTDAWYSKFLYAAGSPGHCYRGSISADGISPLNNRVAHNDATSGQYCVGVPSAPPDPTGEDPRDCVVLYRKQLETEVEGTPDAKLASGERCDSASPIVIELKGKEPVLGDRKDPVTFDILRTGRPIPITWTKRNSDTGFLVMDRNRNGKIDDGGELFGNHTDSAYGEPPVENGHGFSALCEYDNADLGGNANGRIDAGDAVWSRLRIWVDRNHDGLTTPDELHTLTEADITGIDRAYDAEHPKWDKNGNLYKLRGTAYRERRNGREEAFSIYDVVFKRLD